MAPVSAPAFPSPSSCGNSVFLVFSMRLSPLLLVLAVLLLLIAGPDARAQQPGPPAVFPDSLAEPAGPFFVVAGSFRSKASAQQVAHRTGAWVLRSDLYAGMTPGHYAVVFGPYAHRADADAKQASAGLPGAYVRTAGPSMLPAFLGDAALLSALLGEIAADVTERAGGDAPCAPDEPYVEVKLGVLEPAPPPAASGVAPGDSVSAALPALQRRPMGVRGFWVVRRTGEVRRIEPGCAGG